MAARADRSARRGGGAAPVRAARRAAAGAGAGGRVDRRGGRRRGRSRGRSSASGCAAERIPVEGQALPHLLALAARRGACALGPVRDGAPAFVPAPPAGDAPADPVAELARRYLAGHGPAGAEDLAAWSGLPLGAARAGLEAAGARRMRAPARIPPRLLPAFDPYLLGWRDRGFFVAPEHARGGPPGRRDPARDRHGGRPRRRRVDAAARRGGAEPVRAAARAGRARRSSATRRMSSGSWR